ncbi:gamma-glutamyltransferase family protein, partial [Mycobacterium tuberculosis]|nr:gamma-glutamyltransferase family protein [Mycobacterium tuberculosis]
EVYLPGGHAPEAGSLFRNEKLAATWQRVIRAAEAPGRSREAEIEAARDAFYRGFVEQLADVAAFGSRDVGRIGERRGTAEL